jgi:hypothetical protein
MPAIAISAFIGAATLAGGLAGLFLQSFLPEKHTTDRSRDMLAAIVGLISLLLALDRTPFLSECCFLTELDVRRRATQ